MSELVFVTVIAELKTSWTVECNYPGHPVARISIDTLDAVVNGKFKKGEGAAVVAIKSSLRRTSCLTTWITALPD